MRRTSQRGSIIEIVPVLLLGIAVMLGALQVALFMSGRHGAELAAYRASRAMEQRGNAEGRTAARREAESVTGIGYPQSLSTTDTQTSPSRVTVRLRMEPLLPPAFRSATIHAQYPPVLK